MAMKNDKEQVKEKLRAFLKQGNSEDVSSLLVHALMARAEEMGKKKEEEKGE